jgi:hypothetical protein
MHGGMATPTESATAIIILPSFSHPGDRYRPARSGLSAVSVFHQRRAIASKCQMCFIVNAELGSRSQRAGARLDVYQLILKRLSEEDEL